MQGRDASQCIGACRLPGLNGGSPQPSCKPSPSGTAKNRAYKQRARLIVSLDFLNSGHSVKHIAFALGSASSAALVSAFKQLFGRPQVCRRFSSP